jgi:membrane-associated phospholipid phosphatase
VALVKAPASWDGRDWRRFGIGVAVVGAVALLDEEINDWMDRNRTDDAVDAAETIRPLGEETVLVLLGATWFAGWRLDKPKLRAVAVDSLESALFAAGIITPLLQQIVGREKPRDFDDSSTFGSGRSFPSGETTMAFSIASVVAAHSEKKWVDGLAWGLASVIGVERLVLDGHWASDVVAAAFIGTAVGQWVVHHNRPEIEPSIAFDISPMVDSDSYGVMVRLSF